MDKSVHQKRGAETSNLFGVILLIFAVIFFGVFLLSSCIFPTSSTTIKGRVIDSGKRPVAEAEVRFGGKGFESEGKTQADGTFTITARHRPTQLLYLTISKPGVGSYSDDFPGFLAPDEQIEIKLDPPIRIVPRTKR